MNNERVEFDVGAKTDSSRLGSAIYNYIKENQKDLNEEFYLKFVGAPALNQSIKSVIAANRNLAGIGKYISIVPSFFDADLENTITGLQLHIRVHTI